MKNWAFVAVIVGLVVLWYILKSREGFALEFVDKSNEQTTDQTRVSSFAQTTNHFKMAKQDLPPIDGIETPFRVNAFNSFVPV
jgi:hypothetical protein